MTDIKQDRPPGRISNRNPDSRRPPKHWYQQPSISDPSGPHRTSVNRLKSNIRDLTRLLRRPEKLPADVQVVQERALAGYRQALEQMESGKRRKQMISKYHMVRFFGRSCYSFVEEEKLPFVKMFHSSIMGLTPPANSPRTSKSNAPPQTASETPCRPPDRFP